jgi:hypothetical protein
MSDARKVSRFRPGSPRPAPASPGGDVRASGRHASSRRRALLLGVLGIAAIAGFGLAAGLPSVHGGLRAALAATGYLSFILLFGAAMRSWRTDWNALWDQRAGRRNHWVFAAVLATGLVAGPHSSFAQQTIFNLPNADVLEKGKTYLEEDILWRPSDPRSSAFTTRSVWGLGSHVEAGVNFGGFLTPGHSVPNVVPNIKWQPWSSDEWSVTAGALGLFFLRGAKDGNPAALGYGHAAYKVPTGTRLTAGGYWASSGYAASDVQKGLLAGFEQRITGGLTLAADWFSGKNGLGYFSPGIIASSGPWILYAAWTFKNGDSKGNGALIELGFTF